MRDIVWQADAWREYTDIQKDKILLKRVNKLIQEIQRNGYHGAYGKPEMLKGNLSGYASVRITQGSRLIFKVTDTEVILVSCGGHYGDK